MNKKLIISAFLVLMALQMACGFSADVGGFNFSYDPAGSQETVEAESSASNLAGESQPEFDNATFSTEAFVVDVPLTVKAQKENPGGCGQFPSQACNVLDEAGVLGVENYNELYNPDGTKKNNSGEWLGSKNHYIGYTSEVGLLCPEGSYCSAYAASLHVVGGGYDLQFNGCEYCAWGFIARGLNAEDHADRNTALVISDYGALGALTLTRYAILPEHAQFFSLGYTHDQAVNALDFDNCGIGTEDCTSFFQAIMDYNDGSLTILHFDGNQWELVWTNVVQ